MTELVPGTSIKHVWLDQDGVLADFDKRVKLLTGKYPRQMPDDTMWDYVHTDDGFYGKLEPMEDAYVLWNYVEKYEPSILTAIPRRKTQPSAEADKLMWIRRHISQTAPFYIGPFSKDKQRFAKPGHVLIDDRVSNIDEWNVKGGIGVLHKNAEDTIKQLKKLGL